MSGPLEPSAHRPQDYGLPRLITVLGSRRKEVLALCEPHNSPDSAATRSAATLVAEWLYAMWYTAPESPADATSITLRPASLESALRACLPNAARWSKGWIVMSSSTTGGCLAGRKGELRQLRPGSYANVSRPGMPVMPGERIAATR